MENWKKLQNGSDIRGIAMDGIENENINLTPDVVAKIAYAFVEFLKLNHATDTITIAVGRDSRLTGEILSQAFIYGIQQAGAKAVNCQLATTPAMFMYTVDQTESVIASVMITASHLPFNRNGIKFFTSQGGAEKEDISKILEIASTINHIPTFKPENVTTKEIQYIHKYADDLVKYIRTGVNDSTNYMLPLSGLHIIVDAGNGAGGFFAEKVLQKLGANTNGSQFLEPNGHFPNHVPNPENKEAMDSICKAVVKHKADLGIIFDTDVDRSALVDLQGKPINRNALIALISAVILQEHPSSTIVTDSVTSDGLKYFIEQELKGIHHRYKRGYKNVINEGIRLNKNQETCHLAIETSGHAALKENYFLDDGAFLIAKLLIKAATLHKAGKNLTSLISKLKQPKESQEIRYKILEKDFKTYGENIIKELKQQIQTDSDNWEIVEPNYEGIRVNCHNIEEQGWFLLRLSLHDPVMPLNIESNVLNGTTIIKGKLNRLLKKYAIK